jgi:hypothetical protein
MPNHRNPSAMPVGFFVALSEFGRTPKINAPSATTTTPTTTFPKFLRKFADFIYQVHEKSLGIFSELFQRRMTPMWVTNQGPPKKIPTIE